MVNVTLGRVETLWRSPVKSMQGERLLTLELETRGVVGDRAYALIDGESGKVVSAKSVRRFPNLLQCRAEFVRAPVRGAALPAVRVLLADGTEVRSDELDVDARLSAYFGRAVRLAHSAPGDVAIDRQHPHDENLDRAGHRDTSVEQKLGAALFAKTGSPSPVPVGAFLDLYPFSLLTRATLAQLRAHAPAADIDERRFRMNAIIAITGVDAGYVENEWCGRVLAIGERVRVHIAMPDPRCVMVTLAQPQLPESSDVLHALTTHNRITTALGALPCAGVYASVVEAGELRVGDTVRWLD